MAKSNTGSYIILKITLTWNTWIICIFYEYGAC